MGNAVNKVVISTLKRAKRSKQIYAKRLVLGRKPLSDKALVALSLFDGKTRQSMPGWVDFLVFLVVSVLLNAIFCMCFPPIMTCDSIYRVFLSFCCQLMWVLYFFRLCICSDRDDGRCGCPARTDSSHFALSSVCLLRCTYRHAEPFFMWLSRPTRSYRDVQ